MSNLNLVDFLLENYTMLFELIGLLFILLISVHITKKVKRLICITTSLVLLTTIVYYLELWTQTLDYYTVWRAILTAFKYTLFPTILYSLVLLIGAARNPIDKKIALYLAIPILVSIPVFFTSQWTKIVCYFSEGNGYQGGFISRYPYFLFGFYLLLFIVQNIIYFRNYSNRNRFILLFITCFSFLGVILFLVLDYSDNYLPIFTSAIVFYFIFIYIHLAGIDPLTGLVNRQNYYQDMITNEDKIKYVLSIDMNDLKYWNDKFGHDAGDEALKTIANVILENSGNRSTVYRIGGDEFIIFYYDVTEVEVLLNIDRIKEKLALTKYSCSIGYAKKEKGVTVEDTIKLADNRMYEEKAKVKKIQYQDK